MLIFNCYSLIKMMILNFKMKSYQNLFYVCHKKKKKGGLKVMITFYKVIHLLERKGEMYSLRKLKTRLI